MKNWKFIQSDLNSAHKLAQELAIEPLLAKLLINRGLSDLETARQFLEPQLSDLMDPFDIPGMSAAIKILQETLSKKEKITIYGDYDVDGATSTTLLVDFLSQLGFSVDYYIPNRLLEGYSLNTKAIDTIQARGASLIITVDNGIRAIDEIAHANALGLQVIVTDHHEVGPKLPAAAAIVNPKVNLNTPGQELAGVGVAFMLCIALRKTLREASYFQDIPEPNLKSFLDLVCIGTIADMMPLRENNRIIVKYGLEELLSSKRIGLKALIEISNLNKNKMSAGKISFNLAPRINAVGRLNSASLGVRLLLTQDFAEAQELAQNLDDANIERRKIEQDIVANAIAWIEEKKLSKQRRSLILYDKNFHSGVVGIAASRLVERYYLPSIVLQEQGDLLKGSARSISGFNMVAALEHCDAYLQKYGGHAQAAGLTMKKENFEEFYDCFDSYVRSVLTQESDFIPNIKIDAQLKLSDLNLDLAERLKKLEPYGISNAEPLFCMQEVHCIDTQILKDTHVKGRIKDQENNWAEFIAFQQADQNFAAQNHEILFQLSVNEWRQRSNLQLNIKDIREDIRCS